MVEREDLSRGIRGAKRTLFEKLREFSKRFLRVLRKTPGVFADFLKNLFHGSLMDSGSLSEEEPALGILCVAALRWEMRAAS